MNKEQFETVKRLCVDYMSTLTVEIVREYIFRNGLLTTNGKLSKGDNKNFGLELLPSTLGGVNVCPRAGLCKLTCIAFSGVGNILKSKVVLGGDGLSNPLKAKAIRTFALIHDREFFDSYLIEEIRHKHNLHTSYGRKTRFRLNTTSDVDWRYVTDKLSHVQFYDYTKVWERESTPNYLLTFSASESTTVPMIRDKLSKLENVAIVFYKVPQQFEGMLVRDGDETDDRYDDIRGSIIGLKYKATIGGKHDTSFVFGER